MYFILKENEETKFQDERRRRPSGFSSFSYLLLIVNEINVGLFVSIQWFFPCCVPFVREEDKNENSTGWLPHRSPRLLFFLFLIPPSRVCVDMCFCVGTIDNLFSFNLSRTKVGITAFVVLLFCFVSLHQGVFSLSLYISVWASACFDPIFISSPA